MLAKVLAALGLGDPDRRARQAEARALHARQMKAESHDFSYESGERQTATDLSGIRADHVMRYDWARELIARQLPARPLTGGDYFCGNGYGTRILSDLGQVTGIDGSAEAIAVARAHFAAPGARFDQAFFPFDRPAASHDFIVSLESVEHVPDARAFLAALTGWLRPGGILVISTPNETVYPFDPVANPHHVRHFTEADLAAITAPLGLTLIEAVGQTRARPSKADAWSYAWSAPAQGRFILSAYRREGAA